MGKSPSRLSSALSSCYLQGSEKYRTVLSLLHIDITLQNLDTKMNAITTL